jgi:hypothetical protein
MMIPRKPSQNALMENDCLVINSRFQYDMTQQHPPRLSRKRTRGVTFLHHRKLADHDTAASQPLAERGFFVPGFRA